MYSKSFYITYAVWNNAFSFKKRKNKKLFVPALKEINSFNEIKLWNEISFEDYDFDWNLSSNTWLKNFYKISRKNKKIVLFDNHNHAYYFWYEARKKWIIWDNNILYNIDEHSDMKDDNKYLLKPGSEDLQKVFEFTNFELNVGNYIIPAQKEWIIWEVIQIRSESNLDDYYEKPHPNPLLIGEGEKGNVILNLDLDFFQPDLDYIDFEKKKKVILDIANKASFITVASSPFFINGELALKVFKDIFE